MFRPRHTITAVLVALTLGVPAVAAATPTTPRPSATTQVLHLHIPAIGGIEAGPGGVPGGSFQPVTVIAQPGIRTLQYPPPPPTVSFTVADPAPYHAQYSYRYLQISWRNLQNGKTGAAQLRHWDKPAHPVDGYPASLPTSAIAQTGAGPVVATVTVLREQYQRPPTTISVIPGLSAIAVPA
ncbi:hypothetical protein AAFP35_18265 [Gordonia sp. CPCC 206044]|uniref:hypothetical protein n=1 Tax=Gordonia sp. CPCC 206044 TaxID=3140793 RepID=UPI003AF34946